MGNPKKTVRKHPLIQLSLLQAGSLVTVGVVLSYLMAGLGTRWGWWPFRKGFTLLTYGFFGAWLSILLSVIGIFKGPKTEYKRRLIFSIPALLTSLILIVYSLTFVLEAKKLPRIHDITTDLENPPSFAAILPLRKDAPNSAIYAGREIAALQRQGYPDLKPLFLPIDPDKAYQESLLAAQKLGWEIISANPSDKRIEATDTTLWFGFKDDIVIRVAPSNGGSRIDVRSVSRVGLSDIGTNAARIQKYLKKLAATANRS